MARSNSTAAPRKQSAFTPAALDLIEQRVKQLHYAIKAAKHAPLHPETLLFLVGEVHREIWHGMNI